MSNIDSQYLQRYANLEPELLDLIADLEQTHPKTAEVIRKIKSNPTFLPTSQEANLIENLLEDQKAIFYGKPQDPGAVYELFTKEYIDDLSNYLVDRIDSISREKGGEKVRILEPGAGNGKLSFFLQEALNKKIPDKFEIIATDSWGSTGSEDGDIDNVEFSIKDENGSPIVKKLSVEESVQQFKPDIIITSWMPYGEDWTKVYRTEKNVKEYILIGESSYGCCGDTDTWNEDLVSNDGFTDGYNDINMELKDRIKNKQISRTRSSTTEVRRRIN